MKNKKRLIIIMLSVIFAAGYIARVIYVNSKFPKENYILVQAGETAEYDGIEYKGISVTTMTAREFMDKYQYNDIYDDGETFIVVMWIQMENVTDEEKHAVVSDFVLGKGLWSNGIDVFSLWNINGDDFDTYIEAGEKKLIGISSIITGEYKKLTENEKPWTVRITGWPNRLEFIVPVEE